MWRCATVLRSRLLRSRRHRSLLLQSHHRQSRRLRNLLHRNRCRRNCRLRNRSFLLQRKSSIIDPRLPYSSNRGNTVSLEALPSNMRSRARGQFINEGLGNVGYALAHTPHHTAYRNRRPHHHHSRRRRPRGRAL